MVFDNAIQPKVGRALAVRDKRSFTSWQLSKKILFAICWLSSKFESGALRTTQMIRFNFSEYAATKHFVVTSDVCVVTNLFAQVKHYLLPRKLFGKKLINDKKKSATNLNEKMVVFDQ